MGNHLIYSLLHFSKRSTLSETNDNDTRVNDDNVNDTWFHFFPFSFSSRISCSALNCAYFHSSRNSSGGSEKESEDARPKRFDLHARHNLLFSRALC